MFTYNYLFFCFVFGNIVIKFDHQVTMEYMIFS
jgi:hypothetical protein